MKTEELQQMVDQFDEHIRSSLDELIDGFCSRLAGELPPWEGRKLAGVFRTRGWKTAAAHALKKVNQ